MRAVEKPLILGFSLRARAGRVVKPEMPTTRSSSPKAYMTSTDSVDKQAMRCGRYLAFDAMFILPAEGLFEGLPGGDSLGVFHVPYPGQDKAFPPHPAGAVYGAEFPAAE